MAELAVVGSNPADAVSKAHTHLYGDQEGHVEDGFGAIVVPADTDLDDVVAGLEHLRRNITVTPEGLAARVGQEDVQLTLGQATATIESWRDSAPWVNHEDGYALVDDTTGALITTDDGEIWTVTMQQALEAERRRGAIPRTPMRDVHTIQTPLQ